MLIRLAAFLLPLLALLLYTRLVAAHAAGQTHRGDTGLGIALLLGVVALLMLLGFSIDLLLQLVRARHRNALTDAFVIALLLMPFGWVGCNWFGVQQSTVCRLPIEAFSAVLGWLQL
ncbi:hypothetical protein [Stenotrophomonas sp.]|uniref:hypothetical protein n=1 Tax=Stenotrophomonas sp. TaxID=69392 RepID=UPI0028A6FDB6|nr:hypothetical protein [Stenotrophomonas sp.]